MSSRILFGLCLFEGLQDLVTAGHGICEALQPRCVLGEFIVTKITVSSARGQDQIIVCNGCPLAVCVADKHVLPFLIHPCDFSQDHCSVPLFPNNLADWPSNLAGREHRGRHLVEQWLKQVVVGSVNQDHLRRCLLESLRGSQPAKAPTDNDDSWYGHLLLNLLQSAATDVCSRGGIVLLARRPSISLLVTPSSFSTSSLCSPTRGARRAGVFATPCTCIGLLMVEVSFSPAPSSGTTMSFARNCGSLTTSCGSRTAPKAT